MALAASTLLTAPVPADGCPGKREQCVEAAQEALDRGESVLIDRTNVTPVSGRGFREPWSVPADVLHTCLTAWICMWCRLPGQSVPPAPRSDGRAAPIQRRELDRTAPPSHPAAQDQRRPFIAVARQKGVPVSLPTVAVLPPAYRRTRAGSIPQRTSKHRVFLVAEVQTQCLSLPQHALTALAAGPLPGAKTQPQGVWATGGGT